jgi:hypothetical protein
MGFQIKYLCKSKYYKNVYKYSYKGRTMYYGRIGKYRKTGFTSEKKAAKWVDIRLIESGKKPVNILKLKP